MILKRVVDDYVPLAEHWEKWGSIFTLNHPLVTNPSRKKDERASFILEGMLLDYIDDDVMKLDQVGDCMGCGRRNVEYNIFT